MSDEDAVMRNIRLTLAAHPHVRVWRNNVGATTTASGSFVRFGLANDSAALNRVLKSGDLIGIRTVTITPDMVGGTMGQFVSLEVKHSGWKYRGTEREVAQKAWVTLVTSMGGHAEFVSDCNSGEIFD